MGELVSIELASVRVNGDSGMSIELVSARVNVDSGVSVGSPPLSSLKRDELLICTRARHNH
jgi:hypothetical protein